MEKPSKRLLDQVRDVIRLKHYSIRTETAYVDWITRYILFNDKRHPKDLGRTEIQAFLTHLAVDLHVASSTQNQALSAVLFLYRDVLEIEVEGPLDLVRAKRPARLPTVLTKEEALHVIEAMSGIHQLMAKLLYGSGLRLMECIRLRVKDVDFARREIIVRDGKGLKDRVTMLPATAIPFLQEHLQRVRLMHANDLAEGYGSVYMPDALERKYPNANREWREAGNMCFPPTACRKTRAQARRAATLAPALQVQVSHGRKQSTKGCPRSRAFGGNRQTR